MLGRVWKRWRSAREQAAVERRAIPDDLWKRTLVRYPFLRRRDPADAAELRRITSLFLDRKEFSAAGGLKLSDAIAVSIAAQAALPVLKLGLEAYGGFVGIVVHPDAVVARREHADDDGIVHAWDEELAGEAMDGGPVMLSWRDVRAAGRDGSYNVVVHEFAHVLDMQADRFSTRHPLIQREYAAFAARVDGGDDGTLLDPYGATADEEFFAVASEAFFVAPDALKAEHPALYGVFVEFYRQDPAAG